MSKGNKRGFIPPQPAAALSVLDFAAANEAFTRAKAQADKPGNTEAEVSAAADLAAEFADRLLGVPTHDPVQIGQKLAAYHWLHHGTRGLLTDPATRQSIAQRGDDQSQGLLAIYLDVAHSRADAFTLDPAWDQVVSRFEAADAIVEAIYEEDGDEDPTAEQLAELRTARAAMLNARAPNAKALAYKLARLIESQFTEAADDSATNPATISRMLADYPTEAFVASAYQDALALAGDTGPVVTATPDPFDAEAWLAEVEGRTGAKIVLEGHRAFIAGHTGADVRGATAAFDALSPSRLEWLTAHLFRTRYTPPAPPVPASPTPPEEIRAMFLKGYLGTFPQDERQAMRSRLEIAATPSPNLAELLTELRASASAFVAICDCTDPVKARHDGRTVTEQDEEAYDDARRRADKAICAVLDYRPTTAGEMVAKVRAIDLDPDTVFLANGYDLGETYRLDAEHLAALIGGAA